jgi:sugar phosphate isomerase/epimerase
MKLAGAHELHLGYCTNIHAGETWPEVQAVLSTRLLEVRARIAPGRKFGIGLRLSALAARQLEEPSELSKFREFLAEHQLYVFTINGFPFGQFHGTRVKERVYLPDWLEEDRVDYTIRLARILAALTPEGGEGTISTVPGAFAPRAADEDAKNKIAINLLRTAVALKRIETSTGRKIALALEPEPACMLEAVGDTIEYFENYLFSQKLLPEAELREKLGVCFDACHMAVELEEPEQAVERLQKAGIRIVKAQISAGLKVALGTSPKDQLAALAPFAEETYLHQVVEKGGAEVRRFVDLPEAMANAEAGREWRIHFHVPIFLERLGPFENTQAELARFLALVKRTGCTRHLEVETYCWDVLPPEHRRDDMAIAIARELAWAKEHLER